MENVGPEQLAAVGAVAIAMVVGIAAVLFLITAGSLKFTVGLIGNRTPTFMACIGTLSLIAFVNSFIIVAVWSLFGQAASVLVTPLTWFITLYLISQLADCGLIRAFGIWIVNSIFTTVGVMAIMFLLMVPLALMGHSMEETMSGIAQDFEPAGRVISPPSSMNWEPSPM